MMGRFSGSSSGSRKLGGLVTTRTYRYWFTRAVSSERMDYLSDLDVPGPNWIDGARLSAYRNPTASSACLPVPPPVTPLPERTPPACICKIFRVSKSVPSKITHKMEGGQPGVAPHEHSEAWICCGGGVSLLLHLIVGSVDFPRSVHARVEAM
jgi:hypothetical protein